MPDKRTYADRAEYMRKAVRKRRNKLRTMAREYKGGKCFLCGYKKCKDALEFHHIDIKGKDFSISKDGTTRSWERIKNEIEKCILVCANCHRELHSQKRSLSKKLESEK